MAYLLNTSYSRKQIFLTQLSVLVLGVFVLLLYACSLIVVCCEVMFQGGIRTSEISCIKHWFILPAFVSYFFMLFLFLFMQ